MADDSPFTPEEQEILRLEHLRLDREIVARYRENLKVKAAAALGRRTAQINADRGVR